MMKPNPFTYRSPATADEIGELYDTISPIEPLPPDLTREEFVAFGLRSDATYAVYIDSRLAGVAFVDDKPDHRQMAFTKTEYLTTARRLTFARHIPDLLADLADHESRRHLHGQGFGAARGPVPCYLHTPDGDDRSRDWFVRAGCVPTPLGLLVPRPDSPAQPGVSRPDSPAQPGATTTSNERNL